MADSKMNRRWFGVLAGGLGILAATGCNLRQTSRTSTATAVVGQEMASMADMANEAATTPTSSPKSARQLADEMDAHHEARMKLFPAKTEGQGNQPLAPTMDGTT